MKTKSLALLAAGTLLLATGAFAQSSEPNSVLTKPRPVETRSEFKPHVGLLFGVSAPEGSGQETGDYGIDVGYQAYVPFSLGAEYIHSRIDDGSPDVKERDTVWIKSTYNFGGTTPFIKYTYVGVGLGAAFRSDGTSPAIAPIIGFDIPVTDTHERFFSLGANARYAVVGDSQLDTHSVAGVIKYWY